MTNIVEIIFQTEKALRIKNGLGKTSLIPNAWGLKKELSGHNWQVNIKKYRLEDKFIGKPNENLSPHSQYCKGKQ